MDKKVISRLSNFSDSVVICAICHRPPAGFGWRLPTKVREGFKYIQTSVAEQDKSYRRFCSSDCQQLFFKLLDKDVSMNPKENERRAKEATLNPLGDYVVNVGISKGLGSYTLDEIQGLVDTVLNAYHKHLEDIYSDDIPF